MKNERKRLQQIMTRIPSASALAANAPASTARAMFMNPSQNES